MSKNRSSTFSTRSDTNRAVQLQKMARGLKFRIKEVEVWYYLCSENKGADQLCGYREANSFAVPVNLICVFVFAYAKIRFSYDAAHFIVALPVPSIILKRLLPKSLLYAAKKV